MYQVCNTYLLYMIPYVPNCGWLYEVVETSNLSCGQGLGILGSLWYAQMIDCYERLLQQWMMALLGSSKHINIQVRQRRKFSKAIFTTTKQLWMMALLQLQPQEQYLMYKIRYFFILRTSSLAHFWGTWCLITGHRQSMSVGANKKIAPSLCHCQDCSSLLQQFMSILLISK